LGLSDLALGNKDQAKVVFEKLAENESSYSEKAKAILDKL